MSSGNSSFGFSNGAASGGGKGGGKGGGLGNGPHGGSHGPVSGPLGSLESNASFDPSGYGPSYSPTFDGYGGQPYGVGGGAGVRGLNGKGGGQQPSSGTIGERDSGGRRDFLMGEGDGIKESRERSKEDQHEQHELEQESKNQKPCNKNLITTRLLSSSFSKNFLPSSYCLKIISQFSPSPQSSRSSLQSRSKLRSWSIQLSS